MSDYWIIIFTILSIANAVSGIININVYIKRQKDANLVVGIFNLIALAVVLAILIGGLK